MVTLREKFPNTELFLVRIWTLFTQFNAKLLQQLKSGFKHITSRNKFQSKVTLQTRNQYLDYLIYPSIQRANRLFVLSFETGAFRTIHMRYFLPTLEIKGCNIVIDGRNSFDDPIKNDLRLYDDFRKITTGHVVDNTTGCLLDYVFFKKYYKLIGIDFSK